MTNSEVQLIVWDQAAPGLRCIPHIQFKAPYKPATKVFYITRATFLWQCSRDLVRPHTYRDNSFQGDPHPVGSCTVPMVNSRPVGRQHAPSPAHLPPGQGREIVGDALPTCLPHKKGWEQEAGLHTGLEPGQG